MDRLSLPKNGFLVLRSLLLSSLVLGTTGCGGTSASNEVSGTVKFKGAVIPGGSITFVSQNDPKVRVSAIINLEGNYLIPAAPEGNVKVGIEASRSSGSFGKQTHVNVPPKYRDPTTSGVTYTVTSGKQTKDFDLTP